METQGILSSDVINDEYFSLIYPLKLEHVVVETDKLKLFCELVGNVLPKIVETILDRKRKDPDVPVKKRCCQFKEFFIKEQYSPREIFVYKKVVQIVPTLVLPLYCVFYSHKTQSSFFIYPFVIPFKKPPPQKEDELLVKYNYPKFYLPLPTSIRHSSKLFLTIFCDLVDNLKEASAVGFMHWDIKWDNVVYYEGALRLIDLENSLVKVNAKDYNVEVLENCPQDYIDVEFIDNDNRMTQWKESTEHYFSATQLSLRELENSKHEVKVLDIMYRYVLRCHTFYRYKMRVPVYSPYADMMGLISLFPRMFYLEPVYKDIFRAYRHLEVKEMLNSQEDCKSDVWDKFKKVMLDVCSQHKIDIQVDIR
jgi:hypothetical protein